MNTKFQNKIGIVIALFYNVFISCGFHPETLVKTNSGYNTIEQLRVDDLVVCYDFAHGFTEKPITQKVLRYAVDCICIVVNGQEIITSRDQKFYLLDEYGWKKASELKIGDSLNGTTGNECIIEDIFDCGSVDLVDIAIKDIHTFLITRDDILVHNFVPPFFVGLCWALGSGIEFGGATFGIGALGGAAIGWKLKKDRQNKKHQYLFELNQKDPDKDGAQAPGKPTK